MTTSTTNSFSAPDLDLLYQEWSLAEVLDPPAHPTIVVAGAYQGKVMRLVSEMFPDYNKIIGFEPQNWAYSRALENIGNRRHMFLYNCGLLADRGTGFLNMGEWGTDACSVFTEDREKGEGRFEDAVNLIGGIEIDLFIINMEGYEYKLLPYMERMGILKHVQQIAVQFHTKYAPAHAPEILDTMDKDFSRAANHYPSWVYWVKNNES